MPAKPAPAHLQVERAALGGAREDDAIDLWDVHALSQQLAIDQNAQLAVAEAIKCLPPRGHRRLAIDRGGGNPGLGEHVRGGIGASYAGGKDQDVLSRDGLRLNRLDDGAGATTAHEGAFRGASRDVAMTNLQLPKIGLVSDTPRDEGGEITGVDQVEQRGFVDRFIAKELVEAKTIGAIRARRGADQERATWLAGVNVVEDREPGRRRSVVALVGDDDGQIARKLAAAV